MPALRDSLAVLAILLAGCASAPAPDARAVIQRAEAALGGAMLNSISITAVGTGGTFGQAWQPGMAWPALDYSVLKRVADFDGGAFGEEYARSRGEPNGGGATPLMGQGEARASGFTRDGYAWNVVGNAAAPAPVALEARVHDLWTGTPQGAIKAARRYDAVAGQRSVDGRMLSTLSFTVPGKLSATVLVDADGLVTAIESKLPNPVLGDIDVVTRFSDYREVAGIRFPLRIRQSQAGFDVLDVVVKEVRTNGIVDIAVPANVRSAAETVAIEKVADGVWFFGGGSHNSVAIEMADQIVLVESPLSDGRAQAVFAAANRLVPGKTVRTVINSHHHFDHAGGLRYAAAEGATLVTSAVAKPYFERAFANPNTVAPDRLAASGKAPTIVGVSGKQVLSDGRRSIEIHEVQASVHAQGFMMVVLPAERLLIEADAYTPGAPGSPPPATPNANQVNLVQNIERLNVQVDRILPLHGRIAPVGDLYAAIGRKN